VTFPEPPALSAAEAAERLPLTRMSSLEAPVVDSERVEVAVRLLLVVRFPVEERLMDPAERLPPAVRVVPAVMAAEPVAVMVALSVMEPVAEKLREPAEMVPEVTRLPVSVRVKEPPTVEEVTVEEVSLMVALPPVLALKELALVLVMLILPVPEARARVLVEMELPETA